jgi:hypothetical protein
MPLLLIIFIRIFAGKIKQMAARHKDSAIPEPQAKVKTKAPSQLDRLMGYLTSKLNAVPKPLEYLHFEEREARDENGVASSGSPSPQPLSSATKPPVAKLPASMSQDKKAVAAFAFPAYIERLPPLKRAFMLSEILGTPRSLR